MKTIIFLLFFFIYCNAQVHHITHFTGSSGTSPKIVFDNVANHYALDAFNVNIIRSCFTGLLIFYPERAREGEGRFFTGVDQCVTWADYNMTIKSQNKFESSAIWVYSKPHFQFHFAYFEPNVDNPSSNIQLGSFIIGFRAPAFTVYSNENFQGIYFCLQTEGNTGGGIQDFSEWSGFNFTIRSIKTGCHADKIYKLP